MSPEAGVIRVLVVDDQRVIRDGLTMLVGLIDGVVVVGAAADGAAAVSHAETLRPDVVLMDLRMPVMDGIEATRAIVALPGVAVVVLTTYVDDESIVPALRAGAAGYLTKDATAEQIEAAIRAVADGQTWLDPVVQQQLVAAVAGTSETHETRADGASPGGSTDRRHGGSAGSVPDGMTGREWEVLGLVAEGLSNDEIGERLYLARATVKTHINRIFAKTGARDRAQAVRYAYQHGLGTSPRS